MVLIGLDMVKNIGATKAFLLFIDIHTVRNSRKTNENGLSDYIFLDRQHQRRPEIVSVIF